MEQLKKDVLTVTMKEEEQLGTLSALSEQAQKEVAALKKEKGGATEGFDELREGKERAAYERDGLKAKLQLAQREREKGADAVHRVRSGVGILQGLVKKNLADL